MVGIELVQEFNSRVKRFITRSVEETLDYSRAFGAGLKSGTVVCFFGDLGAGKTTFIKGVVQGAAGCSMEKVTSPTFTYLNIYQGKTTIYHFDLYRLRDADEFLAMGFEDYLFADGICCVEWSEKIEQLLPVHVIEVRISHLGEGERVIEIVRP